MTLPEHGRVRGRARTVPCLWVVFYLILSVALLAPAGAGAAEAGIAIELNNSKTVAGACQATFLLRNGLGQTLDRFQLDLYVFDGDGVIKHRSFIDLAPLRRDKTTVITFRISPEPCTNVSKVLVNDVPACRAADGRKLDCLKGLETTSRGKIALTK